MRLFHAAASALALALASQPVAAEDLATKAAIEGEYDSYLAPLFLEFHQNPELGFLENRTAAKMAAELKAAGLTVTTGVGGTGVVGILKNGKGPTILIRADMDGLPVEEKTGLAYASRAKQVGEDGKEYPTMHACGHDTHITAMLATARRLVATKSQWSGTLMFVVQPAEEGVRGAKRMMEDGLYQRFGKPDYALAFHVAAELETGKVSASEGIQYSSSDSLDIIVPGIGTHGAAPHLGRDPVYIASQIVTALQSIDSREISPVKPVVVTVGSFHAGSKHNIISDEAVLQVTVRANDEETREQVIATVERIAVNIGKAHGLPENLPVKVRRGSGTPTTINDGALARRLNAVMKRELGEAAVVPFEQKNMGAEDFTYFVGPDTGVPGYYFAVGGTTPERIAAAKAGGPPIAGHHSPLFQIAPRESITLGARAMVAAVLDLAAKK
ncbi:M20 metallopeptidase family protein [Erythrobacter sp. WG]|uniref:M20 metallopeptidase family protein n=1 Tax=Erythrobacter sp. WG TaxID=2985510 RepID=UPI00226EAEBA|nr:amidohydrolase [Erythrobacter sp. WG]MCX9147841.1 amidohydrolase [Erythrobacter sp. WG]